MTFKYIILCLSLSISGTTYAASKHSISKLDFTQGDKVPENANHDWNLGATGLRGWMYFNKMVTTDARQVLVTKVTKGSPADGKIKVGDVILGVNGKPFSSDPRKEIGNALGHAESSKSNGGLTLLRWRDGKQDEVSLILPILGSYSATAPYDCSKSVVIFKKGCEALAARIVNPSYKENPIPRALNALALLASGEPKYLPVIRQEVEWAANFSTDRFQTWYYGYNMMLVAEYTMATGDKSYLPGLRRLALESAAGQSAVGSWGHGFAGSDRRLIGYGMMNSPGVPLTIALTMARAAGLKDPEITQAINRSTRLLRFYNGKGAIPYGDHTPWTETHEDNGKCGMTAVLFNLLKEKDCTTFFSKMSIASHGSERDTGHTGNFFNILWALPGISPSGPHATGAWMKEYGSWYFDLARQSDGSFTHQGPPQLKTDSYANWDCTGAYLLSYALPLKTLYLTGKEGSCIPAVNAIRAAKLIGDGQGWDNKDRNSAYDKLKIGFLLDNLTSWSPVVRERSAMALARRKDTPIAPLVTLLSSSDMNSRYGACQALAALRKRAAPAIEPLRACLKSDDLWLRIKAAEALSSIGKQAMHTAPELLNLLAQVDKKNDPRGMQQRYFSYTLFNARGGMLTSSLDGVDREALYAAVRAGLKNEDGRARGSIGSVYRNLNFKEIRPLLPAILEAVVEPAPSGVMFADIVRVEGLHILSVHKVEEGILACVNYLRTQNRWASEKRTPELLEILLSYGTHAKSVIPELEKIAATMSQGEAHFPKRLSLQKAEYIRETIALIEKSNITPELITIN
ncbi:HEAT repeat domain-containing protein [Verrucomicrobiaceae bacterium 5K15]|uniref:HEAT repeat domain-containing protein n=1 Tax=Oceaniferula flava TaxID=2800421 RepID=A0AAE2VCI0_9BACT|nr:DUF6288 domain-containing protein [Oceaniferula flavus]MBK1855041.1 HEAT repeat domain-containing protein [Oceaniferula flavus]MBM1136347.1 HEAT repeat domain-containing protein [Oceaniferula flavus]